MNSFSNQGTPYTSLTSTNTTPLPLSEKLTLYLEMSSKAKDDFIRWIHAIQCNNFKLAFDTLFFLFNNERNALKREKLLNLCMIAYATLKKPNVCMFVCMFVCMYLCNVCLYFIYVMYVYTTR